MASWYAKTQNWINNFKSKPLNFENTKLGTLFIVKFATGGYYNINNSNKMEANDLPYHNILDKNSVLVFLGIPTREEFVTDRIDSGWPAIRMAYGLFLTKNNKKIALHFDDVMEHVQNS